MTSVPHELQGPTFLTSLRLRADDPRVQSILTDSHRLHLVVMGLFPEVAAAQPREELGVLYRLEEATLTRRTPVLLIQSRISPDPTRLPLGLRHDGGDAAPFWKTGRLEQLLDSIAVEQQLIFRLRANPTKRLSLNRPDDPSHPAGLPDDLLVRHRKPRKSGKEPTGPRVALLREAEQIDWLVRQGERQGFRLLPIRDPAASEQLTTPVYAVQVASVTAHGVRGRQKEKDRLTHNAVTFDGELTVTDADAFRAALRTGIGPAKAYGFGLLSVRPPR